MFRRGKWSAGTRAQRARCQCAGPHSEVRAQRRRDGAKKVAAAGAAAIVTNHGSGRIGAQPVAAGFTQWINALHGETGQILHRIPSAGPLLFAQCRAARRIAPLTGPKPRTPMTRRILYRDGCGVKRKGHKILGWDCWAVESVRGERRVSGWKPGQTREIRAGRKCV